MWFHFHRWFQKKCHFPKIQSKITILKDKICLSKTWFSIGILKNDTFFETTSAFWQVFLKPLEVSTIFFLGKYQIFGRNYWFHGPNLAQKWLKWRFHRHTPTIELSFPCTRINHLHINNFSEDFFCGCNIKKWIHIFWFRAPLQNMRIVLKFPFFIFSFDWK